MHRRGVRMSLDIIYINKTCFDGMLPSVNFSLHFAYGLACAGARVELTGRRRDPAYTPDRLLESFGLLPHSGLRITLINDIRFLGIRTNQWFYLLVLMRLRRRTAVISRDPGALPYLVLARRLRGCAAYYQPHNFYADLTLRPDVNPRNAGKYSLLERVFVPCIDGVLCLQAAQAVWFRASFPAARVRILTPGIVRVEEPSPAVEARVVAYAGSLQPSKGFLELLQAARRLRRQGYRFVLLGGRDDRETARGRAAVREAELDSCVDITGWMPFSRVMARLRAAAAGVVPLRDNFYNRHLTAPNKLLEMLAAGLPAAVADLPSTRAFVSEKDGAIFFTPGDVDGMTTAIIAIASEHGAAAAGRRARVRAAARRLAWEHRAAEVADALNGAGEA